MFGGLIKRLRASLFAPVINAIEGQNQIHAEALVHQLLSDQRYADPKRLERFGWKSYSQTDEDGIIAEIFSRIGTNNKTFVEFGSGRGIENNTLFLLYQGWHGLWIEGSSFDCAQVQRNYAGLVKSRALAVRNAFVRPDNINEIISSAGIAGEIDLLSVDIDGNDYYVFDAITCINPRVIVVEYNGRYHPPVKWVMSYNPNHTWDWTDNFGASLSAYDELMRKKGYILVGTNIYGLNAFFVRRDFAGDKFPNDSRPEGLFNKSLDSVVPYVKVGHRAHEGVRFNE